MTDTIPYLQATDINGRAAFSGTSLRLGPVQADGGKSTVSK